MPPLPSFLLQLLIESGHASVDQATSLLQNLSALGLPSEREAVVYRRVLEDGWIDEGSLLQLLAVQEGVACRLGESELPPQSALPQLARQMPEPMATDFGAVPLELALGMVTLGVRYPCDYEALDTLAFRLGMDLEIVLLPEALYRLQFARLYESGPDAVNPHGGVDREDQCPDPNSSVAFSPVVPEPGQGADGQVTRYVHWILQEAMRRRASDVHFEPMAKRFQIRCRVDGVLQRLDQPAQAQQEAILSRVKLMAGMDIAEKRLPQDGHFQFQGSGTGVDFRVSTVPSTHGEGIVVRILDSCRLQLALDELGMLPSHRSAFERAITSPEGMVLVTGPTGSGKSTTLYAALNFLNDASRKILTIEDPIEIQLEGVNQVQVRPEVELTFSTALRAMLRQAPNVIMVGEIRDAETAAIAVHASLTGHAVFSTLHTNDAPSAFTRLFDMGVQPFLLVAALRSVLAQRLVRRIAPGAAIPYRLSSWQARSLGQGFEHLDGATCFHAGEDQAQYRGRVAIFEAVEVDEALQEHLNAHTSLPALRRFLHDRGFASLRQDAVEKALKGWTTLEEILAVTVEADSVERP